LLEDKLTPIVRDNTVQLSSISVTAKGDKVNVSWSYEVDLIRVPLLVEITHTMVIILTQDEDLAHDVLDIIAQLGEVGAQH